jgi:hypothetical protein
MYQNRFVDFLWVCVKTGWHRLIPRKVCWNCFHRTISSVGFESWELNANGLCFGVNDALRESPTTHKPVVPCFQNAHAFYSCDLVSGKELLSGHIILPYTVLLSLRLFTLYRKSGFNSRRCISNCRIFLGCGMCNCSRTQLYLPVLCEPYSWLQVLLWR